MGNAQRFQGCIYASGKAPELKFEHLSEAIDALSSEIEEFYAFFAQNMEATPVHPYFGALNREEWEVLHHKHFLHHFEQFGLISR